MKKNNSDQSPNQHPEHGQEQRPDYPPQEGDPIYGAEEDIYTRNKKEQLKEDSDNSLNSGLDVPGAELDDEGELVGAEDEENNYYSLEDQESPEELEEEENEEDDND